MNNQKITDSPDAIRVSIINSTEKFFNMREEWNRLLCSSQSDTIFLTWEWLSSWWKAYGADNELFILIFEKDFQLIGIAPLYKRTIFLYKIISFRAIMLLGDGTNDSDYLDFISLKGKEQIVIQALLRYLINDHDCWDLLLLTGIPEHSPHFPLLFKNAMNNKLHFEKKLLPCAYIDLPASWEDYILSLKPRMRTKIRSLTRRLEENYQINYEKCNSAKDLNSRLNSLFSLHQKRWMKDGEAGVFINEEKRLFYYIISDLFLSKGWLRFYSLFVDNRALAHQFCFEYCQTLFLLQEGFDTDWLRHGIGNVLRGYVVKDCINRNVNIYDFLEGVSGHKLSWGGKEKYSLRISIGATKFKTFLFFKLPHLIKRIKSVLEIVLSDSAILHLKRLKKFFQTRYPKKGA